MFALTLLPVLQAKEMPDPASFDANGDGLSFEEFFRFQVHARKPAYLDLDPNLDGVCDEKEKRAFCEIDWEIARRAAPDAATVSGEAAADVVPPPKPDAWGPKYLRLRKDHESLTKSIEDADPASAGFFRNNLNGEDTWAVEGVLGTVIPLVDRDKPLEIGNYHLVDLSVVASAGLNRVTGSGDGSLEVADSLAFRGGLSWQLQRRNDTNAWWDYQLFNLNYRAEGSTSGGAYKSAGEAEWEPMRSRSGDWLSINGPYHRPFGNFGIPFDYRFTLASRLEFGEDQTDATFLKLGPKAGISVIPTFLPSLSLFANYTYLWETADGAEDFDYFEAGGRWALDHQRQVFLEAKYRFGQLPAKYTDIDLFQLSLAVKF